MTDQVTLIDEIEARVKPPTLAAVLAMHEANYVREALRLYGGRVQVTADVLGISRRTLCRLMRKHKINRRAL